VVADRFESRARAQPDAVTRLRHEVVRYAQSLGVAERVLDGLRLALSEALTNVVMHAYAGREPGLMSVQAWRDEDEHLVVQVCDEGHGLVPRLDSRGLGLGIGLMGTLADEFGIANRERTPGTVVTLRFALLKPAPCVS
jgi:serine/threonine-protein kinase RsbW